MINNTNYDTHKDNERLELSHLQSELLMTMIYLKYLWIRIMALAKAVLDPWELPYFSQI